MRSMRRWSWSIATRNRSEDPDRGPAPMSPLLGGRDVRIHAEQIFRVPLALDFG
jgi:hypothetical protein